MEVEESGECNGEHAMLPLLGKPHVQLEHGMQVGLEFGTPFTHECCVLYQITPKYDSSSNYTNLITHQLFGRQQ